MTFSQFIEEVAGRVYLPKETVRLIYDAMVDVIYEKTRAGQTVWLKRLGSTVFSTYQGRLTDGRTVPKVRFNLSNELKAAAKEIDMEKLGVQTDEEKNKTASETKNCPACGAALKQNTNVPTCPNCGTEPFETKKED